jgi:hypothetical protein
MLAGAWCVFGFVPFETWMSRQHMTVLANNLFWLCAALVFLIVPFVYLVLGRDTKPFSRTWFMDSEERARYWVVVQRMLFWFLGASVFGILWSAVLSLISGHANS